MWRSGLLLLVLLGFSCTSSSYSFQRIEGETLTPLPFEFQGVSGIRDGATVNARASFADGADSVIMSFTVRLGPPAEFQSGVYRAVIAGRETEGDVECLSLNYLGGQNSQPAVGGVFRLKDEANRPIYRIRVPTTVLARQIQGF